MFSNCRGFYKVNCSVDIGFLTHLFFQKDVELLTCKINHDFEKKKWHVENRLRVGLHGQSVKCYQTFFCFSGRSLYVAFATSTLVVM